MIDVHVLTHEGTRPEWLEQCLRSLDGQPANVFVVDNRGCSVGEGRAKGFALGSSDLVAYVDSDDYVLSGCFAACLEGLKTHRSVVTLERVEYADGRVYPFPKPGHNVSVYRREDVTPHLHRMALSHHSADLRTRQLLQPTQLQALGYVWRCHAGGDHHKTMGAIAQEAQVWDV